MAFHVLLLQLYRLLLQLLAARRAGLHEFPASILGTNFPSEISSSILPFGARNFVAIADTS